MATSVSSVTSHFPDAENGFTTTTSGAVTAGATTVGLNSVAGYTNGEPVVMVIDPSNAKKQTFTGIMDTGGSQVTGVVWTAGTNVDHLAGATVIDTPTATHVAMISKGIKVEHNQDGTHKSSLVGMLAGTQTFTGAKTFSDITLNSGSVDPEDLVSGTGTDWAWQSYTPAWTGTGTAPAIGNGTLTGKYIQIGKTVHFRIELTAGGTTTYGNGSYRFSLPVTAVDMGPSAFPPIGWWQATDSGTADYAGPLTQTSTTTVTGVTLSAGTNSLLVNDLAFNIPMTWASGDTLTLVGAYEAA